MPTALENLNSKCVMCSPKVNLLSTINPGYLTSFTILTGVKAVLTLVVDSSLIPSLVKSITLKLVFAASLLDAQHERNGVENKSASLLVVPLGKSLSGIPHLASYRAVDRW